MILIRGCVKTMTRTNSKGELSTRKEVYQMLNIYYQQMILKLLLKSYQQIILWILLKSLR